ncbi:MAG: ABC transporter substrate-binding protein, partial [Flavobacteriales bacterium]|nr:ABC transporter substrate-binding protein [Flavobacteriales bacterium]
MALRSCFLYLVLLSLAACSVDNSDESNVFRYNESNNITTLDPAFARELEIMWATNQLFDGLVELDSNLRVIPSIASRWDVSADGLVYTFHLRDAVYFHPSPLFDDTSGRKVTASDFVYSFRRILDPDLASPGAWIFNMVDTTGAGFVAENDSTLVIRLQKPFSPFLGILTTQYANVVPREVVEHYGPDFRDHPIGTGPFRFAFWYENVALVFHRHPRYWQTDSAGERLPYLDAVKIDFARDMTVEYQGLLQGRYDFMSGIHASFKDELLDANGNMRDGFSDLRLQKTPFIKTDYLGFMIDPEMEINAKSPLLDVRVREALQCAIDLDRMVKHLRNNSVFAAHGGFIPDVLLPSKSTSGPAYNPEKTRALLAEAGFDQAHPLPLIDIWTTSDYADLMEYVQHEWEKFGIHCDVHVTQASSFREMTAKAQVQVFRKSWLADYADAENFLSLFYSPNYCPSGPNYTHYNNPEFDRMYTEAFATPVQSVRDSLVLRMDSMITASHVVIPLYYDQVSH